MTISQGSMTAWLDKAYLYLRNTRNNWKIIKSRKQTNKKVGK